MDVKIISMRLVRSPHANPAGNTLLATFDMHVGPIAIYACALVRKEDGTLAVKPPMRRLHNDKSGYNIRDKDLRNEVARRAGNAFAVLDATRPGGARRDPAWP